MATANPPRPSNRTPLIIIAVIALIGLIAGGVFLLTRQRPDKAVQELIARLPPFVIDRAPARGEEQGAEAPITLSFDKPMDRASVDVDLGGGGQAAAVPIDLQAREGILIAKPGPDAAVKDVVKVVAATRLGPRIVVEVRDANNQIIGRAEPTVEQTAGAPALVLADVPIQVSAAGPGRVLVYAVNARSGSTEHLNSVEVNLVP